MDPKSRGDSPGRDGQDKMPSRRGFLKQGAALVTGAAGGIGRAVAEALAGAGVRLLVTDLHSDATESLAKDLRDGGADQPNVIHHPDGLRCTAAVS